MKNLIYSVAFLALLVGCASETDAPVTTVREPPNLSGPEAARVGEALRAAALDRRIDVVRQALDAGANIASADAEGRTALMLAAFNGYTEIVALLIERGAPVDDRDYVGRTALMYASTGAFGETVELLLESGADPNAADESEAWTALMFAAGEGQLEVVLALLRYGADPLLKDLDGDAAADHALAKGHEEVAETLQ